MFVYHLIIIISLKEKYYIFFMWMQKVIKLDEDKKR